MYIYPPTGRVCAKVKLNCKYGLDSILSLTSVTLEETDRLVSAPATIVFFGTSAFWSLISPVDFKVVII